MREDFINKEIVLIDWRRKYYMMRSCQKKDEIQQKNDLELFKKAFPSDKLDTIEDYVDLFLGYRGTKYRRYLIDFCLLCKNRGFSHSSCQIRELIVDRLLKGDYKSFKLKGQHEIDKMTGFEFEVFVARFFDRCGCLVEITPKSHDKGADLIIQQPGIKTVAQAKRRKKNIGIRAIQEAFAAKKYYEADKALVVISSKFTASAKDLAEKLDVVLWDRQRLMQELRRHNFKV